MKAIICHARDPESQRPKEFSITIDTGVSVLYKLYRQHFQEQVINIFPL
jgi:hypothetical protein